MKLRKLKNLEKIIDKGYVKWIKIKNSHLEFGRFVGKNTSYFIYDMKTSQEFTNIETKKKLLKKTLE